MSTAQEDEDPEQRRKRHGMLKMYYGLDGNQDGGASLDPCDIDGAHFKPDMYLSKLIQEKSLTELMDKESEMLKQIRSLDSDMQTLMKNDFRKMEDEMDHLATNMTRITEFSGNVSHTLDDRRQQITKLAGVHSLLKKLQFLFELPARLNKCIEMKAYTQRVLLQYQHMASFQGINSDCSKIIQEMVAILKEQFSNKECSPRELAECVDLLLQLNEPAEHLCDEFLAQETGDNTILVRALDRFHRRLQAMNKLLPDTDFSRAGTDIVSSAARDRVDHYLDSLKQHFADCLTDVRQTLASPRGKDATVNLTELLSGIQLNMVEQVKSVLSNLQVFIASDITFAMKPYFRGAFCTAGVREGLVVGFVLHLTQICQEFCEAGGERGSAPPPLLLILSRLCSDYESSTISYLITLTEEQFDMDPHSEMTSIADLCGEVKVTAQKLLNHFVKVQGLAISQMLRKSVETRDWLNTIEPRNVRAVMKRSSSPQLCCFKSEARAVDFYTKKLFSEKIEIFSAVEFSKVSVLTGIIKISLKTFLECIRLRIFGRYGLQQIQVDTYYLQLYLWRFVSDETLVQVLLDEIVCSTVHRCLDPVMMEPSVVELICERG
ncbi:VPS51-like protein [Mya arenaria]|uniref:Vacuolar protein sorting-associated protein 51 homolog n=1 Tax=Mya arenaria TaxID=6604 RepID=A0ABY7FJN1_MYAAR|nr:VPS51-like protein [Mya arenaria]